MTAASVPAANKKRTVKVPKFAAAFAKKYGKGGKDEKMKDGEYKKEMEKRMKAMPKRMKK